MKGERDSDAQKNEGLDLGLHTLLNQSAEGEGGASSKSSSQSVTTTTESLFTGSESANDGSSPYAILASQGRFEELVKIAEAALAGGADIEARAWWVYAHLTLKSMPSAFLAAPFENLLLGNLGKISQQERAILGKVGAALIERLNEAGEAGLAGVIGEKLSGHKISLRPVGAPSQLPKSDEHAKGWTLFPERAAAVELVHDTASTHTTELSSLAERVGLSHLVTSATIDKAQANTIPPNASQVAGHASAGKRGRGKKVLLAALIALMCGALYYLHSSGVLRLFGAAPVEVASEQFISHPSGVELLPPHARLRDTVGSLTAIFYGMDRTPAPVEEGRGGAAAAQESGVNQGLVAPQGAVVDSGISKGEAPQSNAALAAPKNSPANAGTLTPIEPTASLPARKNEKETIRVDGPVEPESVLARVQGRFEPRDRNDSSSSRDRAPQERPTLDPRPRERFPDSTGRSPEPRFPLDHQKRPHGPFGNKPQGEIVMGIPEPPTGGQRYQVIARTLVLAEPFYSAATVGRLLSGDIVEVEAKVGEWLKIRSAKGRPGYVLAQDVTSVPYEEYRR